MPCVLLLSLINRLKCQASITAADFDCPNCLGPAELVCLSSDAEKCHSREGLGASVSVQARGASDSSFRASLGIHRPQGLPPAGIHSSLGLFAATGKICHSISTEWGEHPLYPWQPSLINLLVLKSARKTDNQEKTLNPGLGWDTH